MRLELKGFTAWICSDHEELESYAAETSKDGKEVSCWIASEPGKDFSFHWTRSPRYPGEYAGEVYLDDRCYGGKRMKKSHSDNEAYNYSAFQASDAHSKAFFTFLRREPDVDAIPEGRPPAQFNQISLSIGQYQFRAVKTDYNWGIQPAAPINEYDSFHIARCRPPPMPIRATTLKGSLLQLMRGSDQAIPLDMELVARFVFKYGPIDVLKANGTVPLDGSQIAPSPQTSNIAAVKERHANSHINVNPQTTPSHASAEPQPRAKSVKEKEMTQTNRIGSLAITTSPSNPASPSTCAGQKRRASIDLGRANNVNEEANDAARLMALYEEAQVLRSKIIKAKIKAQEADVQALRAELEALTGEPGCSVGPSVKKVKRKDTPQANNTSQGPWAVDLT